MLSVALRICLRVAITTILSLILHLATARAASTVVSIDHFTCAAAELTMQVGSTVTRKNHDDISHPAISAGKSRTKALDTDDTIRSRLPRPAIMPVLFATPTYDRDDHS
jgi:hypothetical protein